MVKSLKPGGQDEEEKVSSSRARQKLGCDTKRISATSFDRAVIDFLGRESKDQNIRFFLK